MAGFLKLVEVPDDFEGRVLNIHPSLIPSFCGQGMYGRRVHQAVLDYGAKITGVTIHFVDNEYDSGPIIWQQPVPVFDDDTADTLADRVFELEKEAYPHVLRMLARGRIELVGRKGPDRIVAAALRTTPAMSESEQLDVIAVGAHPDDVEIACGGTLAALVRGTATAWGSSI